MIKYAVVKTGGKQYLVQEHDEIIVDRLPHKQNATIELETLAIFNEEGGVEMGAPVLSKKSKAQVIEQLKGDKIRVAKFKAKVRYRRVRGFRPKLTKIKILNV